MVKFSGAMVKSIFIIEWCHENGPFYDMTFNCSFKRKKRHYNLLIYEKEKPISKFKKN
jgi:hypothetical protein